MCEKELIYKLKEQFIVSAADPLISLSTETSELSKHLFTLRFSITCDYRLEWTFKKNQMFHDTVHTPFSYSGSIPIHLRETWC